jgi:hypothetical protein
VFWSDGDKGTKVIKKGMGRIMPIEPTNERNWKGMT